MPSTQQNHMKMSDAKTTRVAVIEVGSRAVRILVSDIGETSGLVPVFTDWKQTRLAAYVNGDAPDLLAKIQEIRVITDAYRKVAERNEAKKIVVYGTEALRNIQAKFPEDLNKLLPEVEVLDKRREAEYSLIAAIRGTRSNNDGMEEVLVIDHGAGSLEVATGSATPNGILVSGYRSYKMGAEVLLQKFEDVSGDLPRFRADISEQIANYKFELPKRPAKAVVLGSVATNSAWMWTRKSTADYYDPRKVHGVTVPVQKIEDIAQKLYETMKVDPERVRAFIDPRNPNSQEYEILVTGLTVLSILLKKYGMMEYFVSGYGMRYGVAWALASPKFSRGIID